MKTILIKSARYPLPNTIVFPSLDVGLVGEEGTVLAPEPDVLAIMGVGNEDIRCFQCDAFLAMKIERNQVRGLCIECPKCRTLNKV